ncbi:MAG: type II secretion system F family protein [bacterium]|nr:type II secretion system F family protein [bacterium]
MALIGTGFVLTTLLAWLFLGGPSDRAQRRLEALGRSGATDGARTARERRLSVPLFRRLLRPGSLRWLIGGPGTPRWNRFESLMSRAGLDAPGQHEQLVLSAGVLALTGGVLGAVGAGAVGAIAGAIAGAVGPVWRVQRLGTARSQAISRSLPDVLDLWIACLEAGQGFEAAVHRLVTRGRHLAPDLAGELGAWQSAVALGADRRSTLLSRARSLGVPAWEAVVHAWVQAEETGAGLTRTLRGQRDRIRETRRQQAKERALQAPVKLLFPLVFCIFPALFVVTLGPAVLRLWALFSRNPVH